MSRTTNVHKYFGNHKISLYRHEIRYYLFKCFIILLVFLSTFFLSAADSFKINLKYFYISINCLRTVIWIMHRLLFKLKNIYLNNAFFLKLFMVSGSCPKHCQNKFLTMWYVSKIVVSPFSWQHHYKCLISYWPLFLSAATCSAKRGSVLNSFSSSLPQE